MCYMSMFWNKLRKTSPSYKIEKTTLQSTLNASQRITTSPQENNFFLLNSSSLKALFSLTILHRSESTKSLRKLLSSCFRLSSKIFLQFHTLSCALPSRLKPLFVQNDLNSSRSFSVDPLRLKKHTDLANTSHKNGLINSNNLPRSRSRTVELKKNVSYKKKKDWTFLLHDFSNLISDPLFQDSLYSKISVLPLVSDFYLSPPPHNESSLSLEYMNNLPSVLDTTVAFCIASICMFSLKTLKAQEITKLAFGDSWILPSHSTSVFDQLYKKNQFFSFEKNNFKLNKSFQNKDFSTVDFTEEETVTTRRLLNASFFKKELSYSLLSCKILMGHLPLVTLISGASGCGKSTLALHLGTKLGCIKVITTDTIRHVCCSMGVKNTISILQASTYEADMVLQKLSIFERKFLEEEYGKPSYDAGSFSKCIEGYLIQSRLLYETIKKVVESCIQQGNSVVLEGVHLTNEIVSKLQESFPKRCFAFFIYLVDKDSHLKRLASRSANCEMTPSKNKYIRCLKNIRAIQDYLAQTLSEKIVHIENTSIDCSVEVIRQTIVSRLHESSVY
ncbi:uncharacterized protein LOC128884398 isoform X2 [Hylaeus volcanicus]|nr:uncharacterized protein LOC128884398 isoform X2 [Hylaeus volcanicus]